MKLLKNELVKMKIEKHLKIKKKGGKIKQDLIEGKL